MNIHQFFYNFGNYHDFSLIHYVSAKSFMVCNPNMNLVLHTNVNKYNENYWIYLLIKEHPNQFKLVKEYISEDQINRFNCIAHYVDFRKVNLMATEEGIVVDSDFVCLKSIEEFTKYDFVISEELTALEHKYLQLRIGICYSNGKNRFCNDWLSGWSNYTKDAKWTEFSGKLPDKLLNSGNYESDNIWVISDHLVDPFNYTRDRLRDLFLHNYSIIDSYMFHTSESICWDRYLSPLDIEHIMTVDTTFTKYTRKFVEHLWKGKGKDGGIKVK